MISFVLSTCLLIDPYVNSYQKGTSLPRIIGALVPFVWAIIHFTVKYYKDRKRVVSWKRGQIPTEFEATDTNVAEVFIVLAGSITKRGRKLIQAKEQLITEYIETQFPGVSCMVDESFDHVLTNSVDVQGIVFWCNQHLPEKQKLTLFEFLVWVAFSDGDVNPEELDLIRYVFRKLHIPFERLSNFQKDLLTDRKEERSRRKTTDFDRKRYLITLGLKDPVGEKEIRKTYRALVKTVHPDSHPDCTPVERKHYEASFLEIQEAYEFLTNQPVP